MAFDRDYVARVAIENLGRLGQSLRMEASTGRPEGDFTFPLDQALRDCGLGTSGISDSTPPAAQRAVICGVEYYCLVRLYRDRASEITAQQGAGAAAMHLSTDWGQALGSLRLHVQQTKDQYIAALAAIGKSLSQSESVAGVVLISEGDDASERLISSSEGLPWFREAFYQPA